MEATSLATNPGGKLPGTEKLSALPSLPRMGGGETGADFARELERATERARGEGLDARRRDELREERRASRRAGFGSERVPAGDEARATEAVFRPEHAPVAAQPAATLVERAEAALPRPASPGLPACAPCAAEPEGLAPPPTPEAPGAAAQAAAAAAALAASMRVEGTPSAVVAARAGAEAPPLEPPPIVRAGSDRALRSAQVPEAVSDPGTAQLERAEAILRQVRLHAAPGVQRLTLDLEPGDLGRLSIQLALRTGRVTAIVRAENARTFELLELRKDELRDVLAERGIVAESVRVELGFGASSSPAPSDSSPALAAGAFGSMRSPRGTHSRLDTLA